MNPLSEEKKAFLTRSNPQGDTSVSQGDMDALNSDEAIMDMKKEIVAYNKMLRERRTFVNEALTEVIPFTRENLYLLCAYTGSGKSTLAANIVYPLWQQGKRSLVLTNEESAVDVYFRLGCLHLDLDFNDYKQNRMLVYDQARVTALFNDIKQYVTCIDVTYKDGLTTKLEGVQNALKTAATNGHYAVAVVDYFQLIKYSVNDKSKKTYDVLNDLRIWLGRFIKQSDIPIVMFAQLHSQTKRQGKELDNRIKECPAILEPATVVIEIIPNYDKKCSDFMIHKSRFGGELVGKKITLGYRKGRFIPYTEDFRRENIDDRIHKILEDKPVKLQEEVCQVQPSCAPSVDK